MGLFSTKRRELTPAEEAARRRGIHIPDDDAVNAALDKAAAKRTSTAAPTAPAAESGYETKSVTLQMRERVGLTGKRPPADAKKLEKLIAEGWEIVSHTQAPHGARLTTYVLRRTR